MFFQLGTARAYKKETTKKTVPVGTVLRKGARLSGTRVLLEANRGMSAHGRQGRRRLKRPEDRLGSGNSRTSRAKRHMLTAAAMFSGRDDAIMFRARRIFLFRHATRNCSA